MENNQIVKGYKVFNPDFKCRDFQFQENTEYKYDGEISICSRGFHFCTKVSDCFSYYSFNPNNVVCEVEAFGKILTHSDDSKVCTDKIRIGRRLTWEEVLVAANSGSYNTGYANSGNWNSGNRNSGDSNSGNWNSGNRNSGDSNSGYRNSGDSNSGNWNSGNWNSGNRNSGNRNSGDSNSGNWNSGNWNSGNRNSGDSNSGNWNSGDSNSGNWNSGNRNSGNRNSGNWNSGNRNSGDSNSGYRNSGNWNSGNRNSGDSNSGYRNSGAFCLNPNPVLYLFDKPTKMNVKEWENSRCIQLMNNIDPTIWVSENIMTDQEKIKYPKYQTTEGYLKTISMKEAWKNMWGNLSDDDKKEFTSLENFDTSIFEEITGIKIN